MIKSAPSKTSTLKLYARLINNKQTDREYTSCVFPVFVVLVMKYVWYVGYACFLINSVLYFFRFSDFFRFSLHAYITLLVELFLTTSKLHYTYTTMHVKQKDGPAMREPSFLLCWILKENYQRMFCFPIQLISFLNFSWIFFWLLPDLPLQTASVP